LSSYIVSFQIQQKGIFKIMAIQLLLFDLGFGLELVVGEEMYSDEFAARSLACWESDSACDFVGKED